MSELVQNLDNWLKDPELAVLIPRSEHFLHTSAVLAKSTLTFKSLDYFSVCVRTGSLKGVFFFISCLRFGGRYVAF